MIRQWRRRRYVAFSAVVGIVAFFLSVAITDVARRRGNVQRLRHELVLSATTVRGAIAVYDPTADRALVGLDAEVARLHRRQVELMLALGGVVVVWAGVTRAWLAGRRAPRPTAPLAP